MARCSRATRSRRRRNKAGRLWADALSAEHDEILTLLKHPESDEQYATLLDDRRRVEARQKL